MAISTGSIIQFKTFGLMRGQMMLNTWHYAVFGVEPGEVVAIPSQLANGFGKLFYDSLAPSLANAYAFEKVEVEEVNGLAIGTYAYPPSTVGALIQEALPPQDAVGVQLLRGDRTTRHGAKRFSGIPEGAQVGGLLQAGYQNTFNNRMRDMLYPAADTPLVDVFLLDSEGEIVGTVTLRAIIWGGNDPGYPMGRFQYVAGVDVKPEITTQNTRKVGRGS